MGREYSGQMRFFFFVSGLLLLRAGFYCLVDIVRGVGYVF